MRPLSHTHIDLAALHGRHPQRYPACLESVAHNARTGRYSILFAFPEAALWLDRQGRSWRGDAVLPDTARFVDELDRQLLAPAPAEPCPLPFCGGHFVYLGYEFLQQVEDIRIPPAEEALPVAFAMPVRAAIVLDHVAGQGHLVASGPDAAALLEQMAADLASLERAPDYAPVRLLELQEDPEAWFLDGVQRIQEYIRAGDVFQVNLSRAWQARVAGERAPLALYQQLRLHNPAPFAGFFQWRDSYVLSSSPERLLQRDGGLLQSRPIAGTRPRRHPHQDAAMARELLAHPKERAEHIMLIDLIRNDLGRVCRPGSIAVDELMVIESYRHVHHIVSNVCGAPRAEATPGQMLAALFPGGTITGCPKVRCMEIIGELERVGRGPYTGSMGYVSADGKMDFNILIRSMQYHQDTLRFRAGAGIVADSVPARELEETRAKAAGLLRTLGAGHGRSA